MTTPLNRNDQASMKNLMYKILTLHANVFDLIWYSYSKFVMYMIQKVIHDQM